MPNAPLIGTHLRAEIIWLAEHADIKNGVYRCKETDTRISSQVQHRCQAVSASATDPFLEEHLWATGPGVTDGRMISFSTLWCSACDKMPHKNASVLRCDLV